MAVESHVTYAADEARWSKRLLLVVEGAASRGSRTGPGTAGFVEEKQPRPAHLLVVRSDRPEGWAAFSCS
jgi:hypothetical protein